MTPILLAGGRIAEGRQQGHALLYTGNLPRMASDAEAEEALVRTLCGRGDLGCPSPDAVRQVRRWARK